MCAVTSASGELTENKGCKNTGANLLKGLKEIGKSMESRRRNILWKVLVEDCNKKMKESVFYLIQHEEFLC